MNEQSGKAKPDIRRLFLSYSLLIALVLLTILFSLLSDTFFSVTNLSNMLLSQVVVGMMAIGALFVLIVGEFDLSLGYLLGFCMMVGAVLSQQNMDGKLVILTMIACGALSGLLSGILTVKFKVSSFITTLAVGIALSGLTIGISKGSIISGGVGPEITMLGQDKWFGFGINVWILLALCILVHVILQFTKFGRNLYATGGSLKIAFMSGIKTAKLTIVAYIIAGVFTGLAAVFQLGQTGAALPNFGYELLMPAYAVVFLGSTTYKAGAFNLPGLAAAIVILGVGTNGLSHLGAPFWAKPLFNGCFLVFSALIAAKEMKAIKI